jgi:hypothetical protein
MQYFMVVTSVSKTIALINNRNIEFPLFMIHFLFEKEYSIIVAPRVLWKNCTLVL